MILLPPLAFVLQEYVERIAYTGHDLQAGGFRDVSATRRTVRRLG